MPTPKLSKELAQQALDAVTLYGGKSEASRVLGMTPSGLYKRWQAAIAYGLKPSGAAFPAAAAPAPALDLVKVRADVKKALQRHDCTLRQVAEQLRVTEGVVLDAVRELQREGHSVLQRGEYFAIEKTPLPVAHSDDLHVFESDANGVYRFGFVTDNHLGSKYAREDVLADMYDLFATEGITRVYNAGNWIDGEARFNRTDIDVHGMDNQVDYFIKNYPQRPGITTYYIAGDDHEGWYSQREGIDIGRLVELRAEKAGRKDLRYMGYMEAWVKLKHKVTGATSTMLVVHPGGGSSYAISYAPQKYVEALQGGEKPAIALFGHWHKMEVFNYRNVWIVQGGTTEDQTPFMRKKRLEAHVGGMIIELRQDDRGALTDCIPRMRRYFDRGYYNNSFNPAGAINRTE